MKKIAYIAVILALITLGAAGCAYAPVNTAPKASGSSASSSEAISSSQPESSSSAVVSSSAASSSPAVQSFSAPASSAPAVSSAASSAVTVKATPKITFTIDGTKGGGKKRSFSLQFKSGDTAFSALKRACSQNNVELSYQKSSSVYIQAIEGLAQTTATSGWIYSVNGSFPDEGCDKYSLKSGDRVLFVYTLDLGKTEGAGQ